MIFCTQPPLVCCYELTTLAAGVLVLSWGIGGMKSADAVSSPNDGRTWAVAVNFFGVDTGVAATARFVGRSGRDGAVAVFFGGGLGVEL